MLATFGSLTKEVYLELINVPKASNNKIAQETNKTKKLIVDVEESRRQTDMKIIHLLKILFQIIAFVLVMVQTSQCLPAPYYDLVSEPPNVAAKQPDKPVTKESVCGNKDRFCEILCKNNPAEGGKMCNCDTYALRSNSILI